jgi:two-component system invasion response regulator UvrY
LSSILIFDEHVVTRYGLKQILLEECRGLTLGEAGSKPETLRKLSKCPTPKGSWGLVILGLGALDGDSGALLKEARRRYPAMKLLVFGTSSDPEHAARALHLGATGYLSKQASRSQLMQAVKKVLAGKRYASQAAVEELASMQARGSRHSPKPLSNREVQVKAALVSGKRAADIAVSLGLSIKTVSTYKRRILDKLALHSTADLVRHVIRAEA